jgi:hypothetical protein
MEIVDEKQSGIGFMISRTLPRRDRVWGLAVVVVCGGAALGCIAHAEESEIVVGSTASDLYYLAVFSSQGSPKSPNRTHNWGVAVHARVGDGVGMIVSSEAISWMPRTMNINLLRLRTEPGLNLSHEQSLAHAARTGQRVSLWGVHQITPEAYQQFQRQRARLVTGQLAYQCLDTIGEAGNRRNAVNCVHALADFANILPHVPVAVQPYGDESAALIAQTVPRRGVVADPAADVSWIIHEMGWNGPQIRHRLPKFAPQPATEIATID